MTLSLRRAAALMTAALTLAACGGGDESTAPTVAPAAEAAADAESTDGTASDDATVATEAPAATTTTTAPVSTVPAAPSTDASTDASTDTSTDDGGEITIESLDEMPEECVALIGEFLTLAEPVMSQIDWTTATMADLQAAMTEIEPIGAEFDGKAASSGCDRYQFAEDGDEFAAMAEVAAEFAPGTVGWVQFMDAALSGGTGTGSTGTAGEGPQNCDEAIAYIEGLVAEGKKVTDLPIAELSTVTQAMNLIGLTCDPQVASEFMQREDIAIFAS